MSQLTMTSRKDGLQFKLNVTQFRSPMSSQIDTVQTKKMLQHFPVVAEQPLTSTRRVPDLDEKHTFQNFVRNHQVGAQAITQDLRQDVILFWPERNIENWTGYIVVQIVERRFDYAPVSVTFGVDLIDSLMSQYTNLASSSTGIAAILGQQIPAWQETVDALITIPSQIAGQARQFLGTSFLAPRTGG